MVGAFRHSIGVPEGSHPLLRGEGPLEISFPFDHGVSFKEGGFGIEHIVEKGYAFGGPVGISEPVYFIWNGNGRWWIPGQERGYAIVVIELRLW